VDNDPATASCVLYHLGDGSCTGSVAGGHDLNTSQMRSPFDSAAVADWFVELVAEDSEQDLSNLKLQKLIYLAQSLFLSRFHMPLIDDEFQAWENGPVVKRVYGRFKEFESSPIRRARLNVTRRPWPNEVEETLSDVWECFGGYSAWKLRQITHEAGPWKDHWRHGSRDVVIPVEEIRSAWPEFEKLAEKPLVARMNNSTATIARFKSILGELPSQEREGDLQLLLQESNDTEFNRRRATSLLT
jgi:uncharacterized phage-associated protein